MLYSSEWSSSMGGAPAVLSRMAESSAKIEELSFALYKIWLPLRSGVSRPALARRRNSRCSEPAGTPVRREIMRTWKRSPGRNKRRDKTRWRYEPNRRFARTKPSSICSHHCYDRSIDENVLLLSAQLVRTEAHVAYA